MLLMPWPNISTANSLILIRNLIFIFAFGFLASCATKSASTPPTPTPQTQGSLESLTQGLAYIREHPSTSEDEQMQRYLWLDQWVSLLGQRGRLTPEMAQEYWNDFDSFLKTPPATTSVLEKISGRAQSKIGKNVAAYAAYQEFLKSQRLEDSLKFLERVEEDGTTGLYVRAQEILQLNQFQPTQGSRKIGVLLPLSGELKGFAQEALLGIQIASRMAIAEGVEFVIEDSGSTEDKFLTAWQKLAVEENVTAIIGPLTAKETGSAFERAEIMKVPVISLAAKEDLKSYGNYSFRSLLTIEDQVKALADFLSDGLRSKNVALLIPDSNYGWDVMDRTTEAFQSRGLNISDVQIYPANATDFKDPLRRMTRLDYPKLRKDEVCPKGLTDPAQIGALGCVKKIGDLKPIVGFDTLFVPDFADTAGLVLPTLPYLRMYGVQVVGLSGMNSKKLLDRAGEWAEGVMFTDSYLANSDRLPARVFKEEYLKVAAKEPSRIAAEAYDVALVTLEIMTRDQKAVSRDLFVDRLRRIDRFEGVTGMLSFDNQRLRKKPEMLIVRDQQIRALK